MSILNQITVNLLDCYCKGKMHITWTHTCIDFFNNIEISFIVRIFYTASSPWNCTKLARWKCSTHTVHNSKTKSSFDIINILLFFFTSINSIYETYFDLPVTVLASVRRMFGGFMSSLRMLLSVASGKPLSSISSSNS